jgi:hypothetical protein
MTEDTFKNAKALRAYEAYITLSMGNFKYGDFKPLAISGSEGGEIVAKRAAAINKKVWEYYLGLLQAEKRAVEQEFAAL